MKGYPDDLLNISLILEKAESLIPRMGPPNEKFDFEIKALKSKIYKPPFWIRLGLFIASWLGEIFAMAWVGRFLNDYIGNEMSTLALSVISGFVAFGVARHFIFKKNHYCSGIDDAFALILLSALGMSAIQVRDILNLPPFSWYSFILASIVIAWFSFYYIDRLMAFLAILFFLFGLYQLVLITPLGILSLPVVFFFVGFSFLVATRRWQKNGNWHYQALLDFVEVCCLVLLVLSPQYLLVELAYHQLMGEEGPLPFGVFFQIFSMVVPLVILWQGWVLHNRAMLWVGFIGASLSIYFLGTWNWNLSEELCLISTGFIFLGFGFLLFRLLKSKKLQGFDMDPGAKSYFLQDALSQVIQTTMTTDRPEPKIQSRFDKGDFGGAGSSGEF